MNCRPFRLTRAIAVALISTLVKAITRAFHCSAKIGILVKLLCYKLFYSFQIKCFLLYNKAFKQNVKNTSIITREDNIYKLTAKFYTPQNDFNYNIKSENVTTQVLDDFIIHFSKCPAPVFVAVHEIMATIGNKIKMKTFQNYEKLDIIRHKTVEEEGRTYVNSNKLVLKY